jgi:hypothetical protein
MLPVYMWINIGHENSIKLLACKGFRTILTDSGKLERLSLNFPVDVSRKSREGLKQSARTA